MNRFATCLWLLTAIGSESVSAQSAVIEVSDGIGQTPEVVTIEVALAEVDDVIAIHLELLIPSGLPIPQVASDCGQSAGAVLALCASQADRVSIALVNVVPLTVGTVAEVDFALSSATEAATYPLNLTVVEVVDVNAEPISLGAVSVDTGSLTVGQPAVVLDPNVLHLATEPGRATEETLSLRNGAGEPLQQLECSYTGAPEIRLASISRPLFSAADQLSLTANCRSSVAGVFYGEYRCESEGEQFSRASLHCLVAEAVVATSPAAGSTLRISENSGLATVSFFETGGLIGYEIRQCDIVGDGFEIEGEFPLKVNPSASESVTIEASVPAGSRAPMECILDDGRRFGFVLAVVPAADMGPGFSPAPGLGPTPVFGTSAVAVPTLGAMASILLVLLITSLAWLGFRSLAPVAGRSDFH